MPEPEELSPEIISNPDTASISVENGNHSQLARKGPVRDPKSGRLSGGNPGNKGGGRTPTALRNGSRGLYRLWLKWAWKQMHDPKVTENTALAIGNIAGKYGLPANGLQMGEGQVAGVILLPLQDLSKVQRVREAARLAAAEPIDGEIVLDDSAPGGESEGAC